MPAPAPVRTSTSWPATAYSRTAMGDYLLILLVRDLVDFERVHKTQLSRLPHVAHIQSSLALRDVVRRALPADLLRD